MSAKGERGAWQNVTLTRAILSGDIATEVVGHVDWEVKRETKFRLRVPVAAPSGPWGSLSLEMTGNTHRPASPTLAFFSPHGYIRRLCVNGNHDFYLWTHEHCVTESGVSVREPSYLTPVPDQPTIIAGTWEKVFREFADECRIVVPTEFHWESPWEGA